jgi:hypothetical protein
MTYLNPLLPLGGDIGFKTTFFPIVPMVLIEPNHFHPFIIHPGIRSIKKYLRPL